MDDNKIRKTISAGPIDTYWVRAGKLLAGQYPGDLDTEVARTKIRHLLSLGVRRFIDLTEEGEKAWWAPGEPLLSPYVDLLSEEAAALGVTVEHRRFPIVDMGLPKGESQMVAILDSIDASLAENVPTYVHCVGGKGRTGIVVGCHLVRHANELMPKAGSRAGLEALRRIVRLRRAHGVRDAGDSPQNEKQKNLVRTWSVKEARWMMRRNIPPIPVPEWLALIGRGEVPKELPLREMLVDSLYYPACGFDGTPIAGLTGPVVSFVYADYMTKRHEFLAQLSRGLKGYTPILMRDVARDEMIPAGGWRPTIIPTREQLEKMDYWQKQSEPFAHWSVWRRDAGLTDDHGAELISHLYIVGEISATYQGLYYRFGVVPKVLAVIRPGSFGCEWEATAYADSFFHKVVTSHPDGIPRWLITDQYDDDHRSRYPEYRFGAWWGGRQSTVFATKPTDETTFSNEGGTAHE